MFSLKERKKPGNGYFTGPIKFQLPTRTDRIGTKISNICGEKKERILKKSVSVSYIEKERKLNFYSLSIKHYITFFYYIWESKFYEQKEISTLRESITDG